MKSRVRTSCVAVAMILALLPFHASAALREYTGTVAQILVDEGYYGGCMAKMTPNIRDQGINCGNWVSFDCNGTYGSKSDGSNMLSSAQLALVTGTQLFIVLDTNKKFQELYCKSVRVDNFAAPN